GRPSKGVAEMYRVLKPGGFLAVTTKWAGNMRELYALTTVRQRTVGPGRLAREQFTMNSSKWKVSCTQPRHSTLPSGMRGRNRREDAVGWTRYPRSKPGQGRRCVSLPAER